MKKYIYLIVLLFTFTNTTFAQSVSKYFKSIKKGESISVNKEWFTNKNQKSTYKRLRIYLDSDVREQKYKAYQLSAKVGIESTNKTLRQDVVLRLVTGIDDDDSGIRKMIYSKLKKFDKVDFNFHTQEKLQQLLLIEGKKDNDIILISGWIGGSDIIQILEEKNKLLKPSDKEKFYYNLALSRVGNVNSTDYIVRLFRGKTLNDRVLYSIGKDLLYTKQVDVYSIFIKTIYSEEKNCSPGNPNLSEKINCAYQIMVLLAPYIKDYPIKIDKWGDAIIDDDAYEAALSNTRDWFIKNEDKYKFTEGY